jgi:rod shape-determining protein MreC
MLDIHRRTGYLFAVVLIAQIILISAQVSTAAGPKVLQAVTFGIFSQVQLGTAKLFGSVRSVWQGYFDLRDAYAENQQLKTQLGALRLRMQEQQASARRAAQLEKLLELRQQTSLKTLAANVVAGDATGLFKTIVVDKGSAAGLRKDLPVLAPEGVIGRIVDQPPLYAAKVQLLIDREAGAGAMIERSGAGGVVVGRHEDPPLRMEYVSNLADVKQGDRVLTSGIDGIYPRGFLIGTVERVAKGSGLYKTIEVRPAVDFASLGSVLVVLEPPQMPAAEAAR